MRRGAMTRTALALPAAFALGLAVAAPAAAQSHRLSAAWEAALSEEENYLAPAQQAEINVIAYHAAVAKLCEGFPVDVEKIAAASNDVVAAALEGLEGEALVTRHADMLIDLGTTHGLFLAEGSLHPEKFCEEAAATRAEPDFVSYWR
jgi:hypothetical protein